MVAGLSAGSATVQLSALNLLRGEKVKYMSENKNTGRVYFLQCKRLQNGKMKAKLDDVIRDEIDAPDRLAA